MGVFSPVMAPLEQRDWLTDDDWMWNEGKTTSGQRVTRDSAMRLSTVWGCVRLLTNTIASCSTDLIIKAGKARYVEHSNVPGWMSNPYPADPSMTWTEHVAMVVTSLLLDGNFFTLVPNGVFDPSVLMVLDPRRVQVKRNDSMVPYYELLSDAGQVVDTFDVMHMLHGTWLRMPGQLRGMSPLEAARQGIGAGLAADDYASRFFGQGASLSFGVEYPNKLTTDQLDKFREGLSKKYSGNGQSHAIGVLTDGAKFITGLGVTNEQAQFLETRKYTVEDIAGRIFGIPPHKMGSQEPGATSYNSIEIRNYDFRADAVMPLTTRIEGPYQRIAAVPDAFPIANATAQFKINLDTVARADSKTRAETGEILVRSGQATPDEVREYEDRVPLLGGDKLYMQSQMVPLGTQPTQPGPSIRSLPEPAAAVVEFRQAEQVAPVINITMPPIEIPPTVVNVTTPEVRVDVAPAPTPNVTVDMSPFDRGLAKLGVIMRTPRSRKVEYDEVGRVSGVTET